MDTIRQTAVAGSFYPSSPARLKTMVDGFLENASNCTDPPDAIIVPHAGYRYSGAVAASAYTGLVHAQNVRRVMLIGPSHRVAFRGMALTRMQGYASPLGLVRIDTEFSRELCKRTSIGYLEQAHADEHSLEVHLPFLQRTLGEFLLVPIVTGQASEKEVSAVLDPAWEDTQTLIVVSSDLSHFHDYQTAKTLDRITSDAIETLDSARIGPEEACGQVAINGLLCSLRARGRNPVTIDLRNSGDTAGPRERVVGYGAYVVN